MEYLVKIISIDKITPDVLQITTTKPQGFTFTPGQATELSVPKEAWKNERRPFTFTSLPGDDHLEFVIKTYPAHRGLTNQLLSLQQNDSLVIHDVFGEIAYKGEGLFIAGGAGITPFISIFRDLQEKHSIGNNKLLFANKTKADIILKDEFDSLLGDNFINVLSGEKTEEHIYGYITEDLIQKNRIPGNSFFYLCGPPEMMAAVEKQLSAIGIGTGFIIQEGF